jgi:hypothetical protein
MCNGCGGGIAVVAVAASLELLGVTEVEAVAVSVEAVVVGGL